MTHDKPHSRGHYVHGCRDAQCRELDLEYKRAWTAQRKQAGLCSPSQQPAYHATYMRKWRADRQKTQPTPLRSTHG